MWLNSTAQNALRAVLYIAERGEGGPVRADDIAASLRCPRNYLSKTLNVLARAGVLRSTRGPKGGFQLVDSAGELTLSKVVGPFEPAGERRCLMGRASCRDSHPCQVHHHWARVATPVEDFFGQTTVADLLPHNARSRAT